MEDKNITQYPEPDRSNIIRNFTVTEDNEEIDTGWVKGSLSDGRPYLAEAWQREDVSMLTFYFSIKNIEEATQEELITLLLNSGVLEFIGEQKPIGIGQFTDIHNNELWTVNVTVSEDQEKFIHDKLSLLKY
ncbi:MAG: hypothetical protein HQL26_00625 [Candidatus Omnitrophica bacterium]|nr:hypothetical protein [Candidatus Omnitrophota bacterium]